MTNRRFALGSAALAALAACAVAPLPKAQADPIRRGTRSNASLGTGDMALVTSFTPTRSGTLRITVMASAEVALRMHVRVTSSGPTLDPGTLGTLSADTWHTFMVSSDPSVMGGGVNFSLGGAATLRLLIVDEVYGDVALARAGVGSGGGLSNPLTEDLDFDGNDALNVRNLSMTGLLNNPTLGSNLDADGYNVNNVDTVSGQSGGDLHLNAVTGQSVHVNINNTAIHSTSSVGLSMTAGKFVLGGFSGAQAVAGAATTVPTSTDTALALSTETFDTDTFHDNSTNNSRLTAPRDGYYLVTGEVAGPDADYSIVGYIKRNGTVVGRSAQRVHSGGGQMGLTVTTVVSMTSGQYVELVAWQNSGSDQSVVATRFTITFMGTR